MITPKNSRLLFCPYCMHERHQIRPVYRVGNVEEARRINLIWWRQSSTHQPQQQQQWCGQSQWTIHRQPVEQHHTTLHTIRSAIAENLMLHANFMALCFIQPELLPIEVCIAGIGIFFTFFAPVTSTRWTSHTNMIRIPSRYIGFAKINFLRQVFRKLSSDIRTCRQADIQTDTTEIIY